MFPLHRFICELLAAKGMAGCYKNENGFYVWIANKRVKKPNKLYAKWDSGEPNNTGGKEECINVFPLRGYRWNDSPCAVKMCFVCK